jgi:nucleotide-binding universal stress UspA family protein
MSGSFHPAERIVVPVQGADREFEAQQWAIELAAALGIGVYAVHVADGEEEDRDDLFSFIEKLGEKWDTEVATQVIASNDVVGELVEELEARDLVVIGTRQLSGQYHVGSVAAELLRRAPCPVHMVRLE